MGFTNTPTLETERLLLRRFSENDLYALFKIHSDKDVNTYLPWFPLQSIEEASLFLRERYLDTYRQPYGYKYAICLKNDNIPIGYVNIGINEPHDLGYGLLKAFWRNAHCNRGGQCRYSPSKKRWHSLHYGHTRYQESP